MSIWQDLNPVNAFGGAAEDISNIGSDIGDVFTAPAQIIGQVSDFLSFIAWLFDPLTILRAVEFLTGLFLMGYGIHMAGTGSGEVPGAAEVAKATPVGRALQESRAARSGARETKRKVRGAELELHRRRGASQQLAKHNSSRRTEREKGKESERKRTEKFGYHEAAKEAGYDPTSKASRKRR